MPTDTTPSLEDVRKILTSIKDPEIPVITIEELGILRDVQVEGEKLIITVTPTYSGCPAMDLIDMQIRQAMKKNGIEDYELKTSISPAWTTDWISESGRKKLLEVGIVPPQGSASKKEMMGEDVHLTCPKCKSTDTMMVSQFGSTACKALYKCNTCLEPFEYFKCL